MENKIVFEYFVFILLVLLGAGGKIVASDALNDREQSSGQHLLDCAVSLDVFFLPLSVIELQAQEGSLDWDALRRFLKKSALTIRSRNGYIKKPDYNYLWILKEHYRKHLQNQLCFDNLESIIMHCRQLSEQVRRQSS